MAGKNQKTCPYAADRKTVTQTRQEFNEDGLCTFAETAEISRTELLPCTEDSCGAWHDRRCCYGGERA